MVLTPKSRPIKTSPPMSSTTFSPRVIRDTSRAVSSDRTMASPVTLPTARWLGIKKKNTAIGQIKFQKDIRRYRVDSFSIGYELAREYWGNGYMPEALAAMVRCAFEQKGARALGIAHFTENDRSRRVIEKCGFLHEGTIRRAFCRFDGVVFDDECYSILREEYESGVWQSRIEAELQKFI